MNRRVVIVWRWSFKGVNCLMGELVCLYSKQHNETFLMNLCSKPYHSQSDRNGKNGVLWLKAFQEGLDCSDWQKTNLNPGHEVVPNTGANAPKFFTLVTKSWQLVTKLATRMFHHNLTKRYSELKRFAKINLRQTSSLSLFPKRSTCISSDN